MRSLTFLLLAGVLFGQSQTQPVSLQINQSSNITSPLQVFDNRSSQRQCNNYTYSVISGSGTWSVQIEYSTVGLQGPWYSFGSYGVVTSSTTYPIGWAFGYRPWIRINTTVGTTVVNFSCQNQMAIPPSGTGAAITSGLTNGNFVVASGNTSITDSGHSNTHSAVVGISDTQTLTNKIISYLNNSLILTSGTAIQKANGTGGFANALSGVDYAPPTSGTLILKGNGAGGFSNAIAGTDYPGLSYANVFFQANTFPSIIFPSADSSYANIKTDSNNYLDLTPPSGGEVQVLNHAGTTATGTLQLGALVINSTTLSGGSANISGGNGSPSGACTNGYLYLQSDAGGKMWFCTSTAWAQVTIP